jgi:UDP-N-acetylmuramate--alanine ligase
MRRIKRIHMVGVGGSGMSGIAEVLLNLGYKVSGSDLKKSEVTERLKTLGGYITYSHIPENIIDCDVLVASSAISEQNIEIKLARQRRIPVVPRAEMLSELMRFKKGIAIAGTHGKTTITSLSAAVFAEAGLEPTYVVGGMLNSTKTSAKLGDGDYFIAESDESDASFLQLMPVMVTISNIDNDHLSTYRNEMAELRKAFTNFANRVPFYGLVVACIDDAEIKKIIPNITRPLITYGFSDKADVRASDLSFVGTRSIFKIKYPGFSELFEVELNLPGRHNVLNALATITLAVEAGIDMETICKALSDFSGVSRRFDVKSPIYVENRELLLIDDYGHHPTEIKAVIDAAKISYPNKRVVMIFQPHRYTRTKQLFEDFANVLSVVDELIMLNVYSAGEEAISGYDSKTLCAAIRQRGKVDPIFVQSMEEIPGILTNVCMNNDLLITQGAGDISKISNHLQKVLAKPQIVITEG